MTQENTTHFTAYRNPDDAFDIAIDTGRLSADKTADNFAGKYMYMGECKTGSIFKNINTREYI
jgi:hypothetical protein